MKRLEFDKEGSSKFWEIQSSGNKVVIQWGKIGTQGQSKQKLFAADGEAETYTNSQIKSKLKKGYKEVRIVVASAGGDAQAEQLPETPAPVKVRPADTEETVLWTKKTQNRCQYFVSGEKIKQSNERPETLWQEFCKTFRDTALKMNVDESEQPGVAQELVKAQKIALNKTLPTNMSVDTAAILIAYEGRIITFLVAQYGLNFAIQATLKSLHYHLGYKPNRGFKTFLEYHEECLPQMPVEHSFALVYLRLLLDHLSPEAARKVVDELGDSRVGASLLKRVVISFLFRHQHDWQVQDARDWLATEHVEREYSLFMSPEKRHLIYLNYSGWYLLTVLKDPQLVAQFFLRLQPLDKETRRQLLGGLGNWIYIAVEHLGASAVAFLKGFIEGVGYVKQERLAAEALAMIQTREAFQTMCQLIKHPQAAAAVKSGLEARPELAMEVFSELVLGGKNKSVIEIYKQFAKQFPEAFNLVLANLSQQEQEKLSQLGISGQDKQDYSEAVPDYLTESVWQCFTALALPENVTPGYEVEGKVQWRDEDDAGSIRGYVYHKPPLLDKNDDKHLSHIEAVVKKKKKLFLDEMDNLSLEAAVKVWNKYPMKVWYSPEVDRVQCLLKRFGLDGLKGFIEYGLSKPAEGFFILTRIITPEVVMPIWQGLHYRIARNEAQMWLHENPEVTVIGLLQAMTEEGEQAQQAQALLQHYLFYLPDELKKQLKTSLGQKIAAFAEQLQALPLLEAGIKQAASLPKYLNVVNLASPVLRADGKSLPPAALNLICQMLSFTTLYFPYVGLAQLKQDCTAESLDKFAWSLFQLWLSEGAPGKDEWLMMAIGHLGGSYCVSQLAPMVEAWPGQQAHHRAVSGLDVLAMIGTDESLMRVHKMAEKSRFPGLREQAQQCLRRTATLRGLTVEELVEGMVPVLGLDAQGERIFDYGARQFVGGINDQLKPFVIDEKGKQRASLPKPAKSDDEVLASQTREAWKQFKKEAQTVLRFQVQRLEIAMCRQRYWTLEEFESYFVKHPVLNILAKQLIWGIFDSQGLLSDTFMVHQGNYLNKKNKSIVPEPEHRIGLVHPVYLQSSVADWLEILVKQAVTQPVEQLSRRVYFPQPMELLDEKIQRINGVKVPSGKLLSLINQGGWKDRDGEGELEKAYLGGYVGRINLEIRAFAIKEYDEVMVYDGEVMLEKSYKRVPVGALPAVTFSELIRDIESLKPEP